MVVFFFNPEFLRHSVPRLFEEPLKEGGGWKGKKKYCRIHQNDGLVEFIRDERRQVTAQFVEQEQRLGSHRRVRGGAAG